MNIEERFLELEKKAAYLDHTVQELHEVILDQAKTIDALNAKIEFLAGRLHDERLVRPQDEEEPPPHY